MSAVNSQNNHELIRVRLKSLLGKRAIEVPMLPEVAGKAVRLTQDPDSEAAQLSKLIQSDQALAGHVMRVANSAAYSPTASIQTLQQAIARLGMKLIAEIALAASVNSSLFDTPGFDDHIEFQLKFSLASALWAKEAARACRKNVEAAFLAGLLHDIGRPVAVQGTIAAAKESNISLHKEEVLAIEEEFQRSISIHVVEKWEMPQAVQEVVRFFENYDDPHQHRDQTLLAVAGDYLAQHFFCENDKCIKLSKEDLMKQSVFSELNLYQDEIEQLLEREDAVNSAIQAMSV